MPRKNSTIHQRTILVVAAHPDDELLGAGGALVAHRAAGDTLAILLLSSGEVSRDRGSDPAKRIAQARIVAKRLGATLFLEDFPDNAFDQHSLLEITKAVECVIAKVRPSRVYTHHAHDLNVDHRLTFQAVLTACRPQPNFPVRELLNFEILSSTEWQTKDHQQFAPNYYMDIAAHLDAKKELLAVYADELRSYPHPRSLEGIEILAKFRGLEVGLKAAEAFRLVRAIL